MIGLNDSPTWEYDTTSNNNEASNNISKVNNVQYRLPNVEYGLLNGRREPSEWDYQPQGKACSPLTSWLLIFHGILINYTLEF